MSPLRDICEVQYDAWFCERKNVDVAAEPSDVCTANGISIYQNLDWKDGTARWTSVSPDNQAVAFDARPGGTYRIYFRNVVGTSQQAGIEILGEQGSWSPDSQQMVYRSGRDNQQGLWIANRDDTGHRSLTNTGTDSFPIWSPNGRTIAFSREIDGNVDIYTIGVDGSNVQRLTDAPGPDSLPVYTPDGQIIFRSARTGSWGIWKMNGNGSNQQEIIPNADVSPDWAFNRMDVR
jgi:Tol biopolymer transport system component